MLTAAVDLHAERYLVATRRPARQSNLSMLRVASHARAHDVRAFQTVNGFAADLTAEEAAELRHSGDVIAVEPVVPTYASGTPAVASNRSNWKSEQAVPYGVDVVRARDVWPYTKGAADVNVVVMDTGIDMRHLDLAAHFAGGFNAIANNDNPFDDNFHGTHVAGTIGAMDNGFGVVGIAPEAKIWAVKVLRANGTGTDDLIVAGMDWVIRKKRELGGNWIVNLSLGMGRSNTLVASVFAIAAEEGILIVAAAGNQGVPTGVDYPAAYPDVIAVGALTEKRTRATFSNHGTGLSLMAPGVDVYSTFPVGAAEVGEVEIGNGVSVNASPLDGSPQREVRAPLVFCGFGRLEDFPADVAGKIALVRRGHGYFRDKARNAKMLGAVAVVIMNDDDRNLNWPWTLIVCDPNSCDKSDATYDWPLTLGVSAADAEKLLARTGSEVVVSHRGEDYAKLNGTSMAAPHVAGVAALVWSLAPRATAREIRTALTATAQDLGELGFDPVYGHGAVDALNAGKFLAPGAFSMPATPFPRRRRAAN